ncbi:MAG: hypothetical protein ACI9RM_001700, partial [Ulvibacter sp.]
KLGEMKKALRRLLFHKAMECKGGYAHRSPKPIMSKIR